MRLKLVRAQCDYCSPRYVPKSVRRLVPTVKMPNGLHACAEHVIELQKREKDGN